MFPKGFKGVVVVGGCFCSFVISLLYLQLQYNTPVENGNQQSPFSQKPPWDFSNYYKGFEEDAPITDIEYCREAIKESFRFAFRNYIKYGWGHDELQPISKKTKDQFGGWGTTIIDSISTLLLMNLTEETALAKSHVATLNFRHNVSVSVFENIIRNLGGLLSAYDLTKEPTYLQKAKEFAIAFLPAFNTTFGFPYSFYNPNTGLGHFNDWNGGMASLAEVGTFQVEFERLSQLTGNSIFSDVADHFMKKISIYPTDIPGLFPSTLNPYNGVAMWDVVDENFLNALVKNIVGKAPTDQDIYFLGQFKNRKFDPQFDHLSCFLPGTLALGYLSLSNRPKWEMELAEALTSTCYYLYRRKATGLSPDSTFMTNGYLLHENTMDEIVPAKKYLIETARPLDNSYFLRPETAESIFYLYRATKDPKYLRWGWNIFKAINQSCRAEFGFSSVKKLYRRIPKKLDEQPSYFFAETLKYLYLLMSPDEVFELEKYVLNTEAHPLLIES